MRFSYALLYINPLHNKKAIPASSSTQKKEEAVDFLPRVDLGLPGPHSGYSKGKVYSLEHDLRKTLDFYS
jgi:hypothetical protein